MDRFSLPKLRIWTLLLDECLLNDALTQAQAVWQPDKSMERLAEIREDLAGIGLQPGETKKWEAPSVDRIRQRMKLSQ